MMNKNLRKKLRDCVKKVGAKGYAYNPWAVCRAAFNKSGKKKEEIIILSSPSLKSQSAN